MAKSVAESLRGLHPVNVFVRVPGKDAAARPLTKIYNTARERAGDAKAGRLTEVEELRRNYGLRR